MTFLTNTVVTLTNPRGETLHVKDYEVSVKESIQSPVKTIDLVAQTHDERELKKFTIGSEIKIEHALKGQPLKHLYTGVITQVQAAREGRKKVFTFNGECFLGKTQRRIVNESFVNTNIKTIVQDLLKFAPYLKEGVIQETNYDITIKFDKKHLFSCLQELADTIDYTFNVDKDKKLNFYQKDYKQSSIPIERNTYKKGTANLAPSTEKLVNRLYCEGSIAVSQEDTTQYIKGDGLNDTYSFLYKPNETLAGNVIIEKNGVSLSVGTENLQTFETHQCLINYGEKTMKFPEPLLATDTIKTVYRYSYPLTTVVEDFESQRTYGEYDDIFQFNTQTIDLLREKASIHLRKYARPIITGSLVSLKPADTYEAGEIVTVDIPELGIKDDLQITEKNIHFSPNHAETSLTFEQSVNVEDILELVLDRLLSLEESQDESPIEKYNQTFEPVTIKEEIYAEETKTFLIETSEIA